MCFFGGTPDIMSGWIWLKTPSYQKLIDKTSDLTQFDWKERGWVTLNACEKNAMLVSLYTCNFWLLK
jgi:hypothetical protein